MSVTNLKGTYSTQNNILIADKKHYYTRTTPHDVSVTY